MPVRTAAPPVVVVRTAAQMGERMEEPADDQTSDMWFGTCPVCGKQYDIPQEILQQDYPEHADVFTSGQFEASCACGGQVLMSRTTVKVLGFEHMNVLPAAHGCPACGRDHEPDAPHDAHSLVYQYTFRSQEARAGREQRWPTWHDAMAHCTPEVQDQWIRALTANGVDLEPHDQHGD